MMSIGSYRTGSTLFNVKVPVVELVWADTPEQAIDALRGSLRRHDFEPLPDGNDAFVSEPVEDMGWFGENDE
jgi:hypothetical protein